jgi:hypothetical protein
MSVIVERPYKFVPPHRGNLWPSFIQRFRMVDFYLKRKEGVVSYECRHTERLTQSLRDGHGILLAPNHCRYADPLALGWLSRDVQRHVFAMASWHLFNKGFFDRFAIPKMGGFSIFREGADRQSLETAIDAMVEAKRPLIVFPEGTTNRTNDHLQPLLEGVTFMARTAAKRRAKTGLGKVVIHPIGIKYLFRGDIHHWADIALSELETRLSWEPQHDLPILRRISQVGEGILSLKEIQYLGSTQTGTLIERRDNLIASLLRDVELEFLGRVEDGHVLNRVRSCRVKLMPALLESLDNDSERQRIRRKITEVDLAQQLVSYPQDYLDDHEVTDTRVLETLERMQEDFLGRSRSPKPLHAVMEVGEPITVDTEKSPRGQSDPILDQLQGKLLSMLERLSAEAKPFKDTAASPVTQNFAPSNVESRNRLSTAEATVSATTESRISL